MASFKTLVAGGLCWLAFAAVTQAADAPAIQTFTLKNGMPVVLLENHRVPAVTHMLWYHVGSADDFPGRSGLAHYNEHMMFQGTKVTAAGQFIAMVMKNGGHTNAFTSHDYTAFYVTIAKEHLPTIMGMEADRMLNLAPTAENFAKEREVIIEERRMTVENQPESLLSEELHAMLWRNHPYHNPLIGWMQEMQALSREDVLAFHAQFYHPANVTLIVAGDITRAELEPLAQQYYGTLPAGEAYVRHWRVEPPQRGARHISLHHVNVKQPQWIRYYAAPSVNTDDKALVIPTYVLAQVIGGGSTSRLYQSLVVKQKLATAISADYDGIGQGPGEIEITATPAEGVSLPQLETAIDGELALIATDAVPADALTRAKTLLKAETIYARDGLEGMARILGVVIMAGLPPDYFNQWPSFIDAVSEGDIHKAAQGLFNPDACVTGYLLPVKGAAK